MPSTSACTAHATDLRARSRPSPPPRPRSRRHDERNRVTPDAAAQLLRDAYPAAQTVATLDARALHDLDRILATPVRGRALATSRRRKITLAAAAGLAAAAVVTVGVVAWPSGDTPASSAFAVTRPTSETVLLTINGNPDRTAMQQALDRAGVPAVVLLAAAPGTCSQSSTAVLAAGAVTFGPNGVGSPSELGTTITPSRIPDGTSVLIIIAQNGDGNSTTSTSLVANPAPSCAYLS